MPEEVSSGPGTPPPAATVVAGGTLTEGDAGELIRLRQENERLAGEKKSRELELMKLQDENSRLKSPPTPAQVQKKGFLEKAAEWFPRVD